MAGKHEEKASEKEVQDFRDALDKMDYSLGAFCQLVAVEEGRENTEEENKIVANVKRSFSRTMKKKRLQQYWEYLANEPNFDKVGRVVLPHGRGFLSRSKYADQIMSAFHRGNKGSAK